MDNTKFFLKSTPANAAPILLITAEGRLFWHNREVETDDDLRTALLELRTFFNAQRATNTLVPAHELRALHQRELNAKHLLGAIERKLFAGEAADLILPLVQQARTLFHPATGS